MIDLYYKQQEQLTQGESDATCWYTADLVVTASRCSKGYTLQLPAASHGTAGQA